MKNPSDADADADLSPDQNLLVPAIIATAIQLSYFCVRLNKEKVPHNTFCVNFNDIKLQSQPSEIPKLNNCLEQLFVIYENNCTVEPKQIF